MVRSQILAQAEAEQGPRKEAENIARQSVADLERAFGPQHPETTAAGYVNLAKILRYRRRCDEAAQALLRAQAIDRQAFAPDHPRIANDLNLQGALAFDRKKYAEAEKLFQQSSPAIPDEAVYAAADRYRKRATANLAEVYMREKRFTEAVIAFDQALTILAADARPRQPGIAAHDGALLTDPARAAGLRESRRPRRPRHENPRNADTQTRRIKDGDEDRFAYDINASNMLCFDA